MALAVRGAQVVRHLRARGVPGRQIAGRRVRNAAQVNTCAIGDGDVKGCGGQLAGDECWCGSPTRIAAGNLHSSIARSVVACVIETPNTDFGPGTAELCSTATAIIRAIGLPNLETPRNSIVAAIALKL